MANKGTIAVGAATLPHSKHLKILHICPLPNFSGLEAYALAMAKGQQGLGHQVEFVVRARSPLAEKCHAAGIKTLEKKSGVFGLLAFIFKISKLFISSAPPQIAHLHSTQDIDFMLVPLILSRLKGSLRPKIILQSHIWISHSKRDPLHAFSYFFIDEIWCSSKPARESLEKFLPVSIKKIRIVKYGREINEISSALLSREASRLELHLPSDAIVVGAVARIDEGKGTRELLEAALQVMQAEPLLHLIWIGPPTAGDSKAMAYHQSIQARLATLPLDLHTRVHMPGMILNSYRLLRAFDLFALPTYMECFSLSLLEAQLAALPVLGSRAGGTPEVVREKLTGWLFDPKSVSSLREALQQALTERQLWLEFGRRAEARIRSEFDFAQILPQTIDHYRSLLT